MSVGFGLITSWQANKKPRFASEELVANLIKKQFGKLHAPILNILTEILAPLHTTFKQEVENEQPYLKGNKVFDDLILAGVEEKKEKLLAKFSELLILPHNKETIEKQAQTALSKSPLPALNQDLKVALHELMAAAKAALAVPKIEEAHSIQIGLGMSHTRGVHFSTVDFPLLKPAKYATSSSSDIHLDFGDKIFTLPQMFMHYIDDVESIGWSWVLPKDFLECLKRGHRPVKGEIERHAIGYLTTKQDGEVYESASDAGQKNNLIKATTAKNVMLEPSILALLQSIDKYVNENRLELPCCNQTKLVTFDLKAEVKKVRPK